MSRQRLNAAQIEILVSHLISQGHTRVHAEEMVADDPDKVQRDMDRAAEQSGEDEDEGEKKNSSRNAYG